MWRVIFQEIYPSKIVSSNDLRCLKQLVEGALALAPSRAFSSMAAERVAAAFCSCSLCRASAAFISDESPNACVKGQLPRSCNAKARALMERHTLNLVAGLLVHLAHVVSREVNAVRNILRTQERKNVVEMAGISETYHRSLSFRTWEC